MYGLFEPAQRVLTEQQFVARLNGTKLTYEEMQFLRLGCGLPHDEDIIIRELLPQRAAAAAWRKVMGDRVSPI